MLSRDLCCTSSLLSSLYYPWRQQIVTNITFYTKDQPLSWSGVISKFSDMTWWSCFLDFSAQPGVKIALLSKCHSCLDCCCCNSYWYCIPSHLPNHVSSTHICHLPASPAFSPTFISSPLPLAPRSPSHLFLCLLPSHTAAQQEEKCYSWIKHHRTRETVVRSLDLQS